MDRKDAQAVIKSIVMYFTYSRHFGAKQVKKMHPKVLSKRKVAAMGLNFNLLDTLTLLLSDAELATIDLSDNEEK